MNTRPYKFLINTITHWNEPPRARHQVAYALAKNNPVVFVSANRVGFPKLSLIHASGNMEVIIPYFPIDSRIRIRIPIFNRIYQKWLFRKLRTIYGDYSVINFDFTAKYLFLFFKHVIYYCNDDHIKLSHVMNMRWVANYHDKSERAVASGSKFCIGTSEFLTNKLKLYNKNAFEIRLGAPTINYIPDQNPDKQIRRINVGFVGFVDTIDFKLINFLLSKHEINFTIIGPVKSNFQKCLGTFENVRFTGKLTGLDLYNEVSRFDVGIIPYNIKNEIDRTPNKLWLYLALGVPVVISNIKGIRDWVFPDKFVYLSDNNIDFHEKILQACKEDNRTLRIMRAEFAASNTWDIRIQDLLKIYEALNK